MLNFYMKLKNLSIIVPSKYEYQNLKFILPKLKKYSSDVIVADSSSNDGTKELCKALKVSFVLDTFGGKGAAQILGVKKAINSFIVFFDSDGSHEVNDIPKLYKKIKKFDLVICSRQTGGSFDLDFYKSIVGLIRSTGCLFLTYFFNKLFKKQFTDILYSFRAVKRKSFLDMKISEMKFGIEIDMITCAIKKNMSISEIPSRENQRIYGVSKLKTLSGIYFIYQLLRDYLKLKIT